MRTLTAAKRLAARVLGKQQTYSIEEAKQMARDNDVVIIFVYSAKWLGEDDPLRPSKDNHVFSPQHLLKPYEKEL